MTHPVGVCFSAFSEEMLNLEDKLFPELDDLFNKDIVTALNAMSNEKDIAVYDFQSHIQPEQASKLNISLEADQETKDVSLHWNIQRGSKCESGEKETCPSRKFVPRANATGLDNCPVAVYKKLKSHRPPETLHTDSPFFLQINRSKKFKPTEENYWYSTLKMGKNSIGSLMKSAASDANLDTGHKN